MKSLSKLVKNRTAFSRGVLCGASSSSQSKYVVKGRRMLLDSKATSGGTRLQHNVASATLVVPLITVITAVFNGQDCIADCIESVLHQDFPNVEHIILDGNSEDGTVAILRHYENKVALWLSEPDSGVYDAWNKGLEVARGEWIAFLGADDRYLPNAISTYVDLARRVPDAEFLTSRAQLNHPSGYAPVFGGAWEWPRFSKTMTTIHVGTMHRRSLFERYGKFDTSFLIAGDYEFLLRPRANLRTAFTPATTVVMRAGGLSDGTAGLYEARRARVEAGVRAPLTATIELRIAVLRFHVRRLFLALRSALKP
jgi:glycosyltransferase involved in cell wall biosynthesis